MLVNHTASISPTRQHKRKKACLFMANFEESSLSRIKKWGWFGYNSVVSLQVRGPVENATAICVSGQSLMWQMDLCGAASAKVVKQLFLPETARSSRTRNCPWVNCLWALETSIVSATAQLAVAAKTLVDFYNFLREVCSTALIRNPVQLGGPGRIVQIDESLFAHKLKYHRGRAPQSEIWVFGMADCTSNPALGFMQIVVRRNAPANNTAPYSAWLDCVFRPVGCIQSCGKHRWPWTSHCKPYAAFCRSVTGVHTQNIESCWNRCKTKIKSMKGVRRDMLPGYLDEFMWRERAGPTNSTQF